MPCTRVSNCSSIAFAPPDRRIRESEETGMMAAVNSVEAPTALIIDDDQEVLATIAELVRALGFKVLTAEDGLRGVEVFRRSEPDVVLIDIVMPEQDGIGAILQMRSHRPDAKIIAMSGKFGDGHAGYLAMAKKLGANAVLAKPFGFEELARAMCAVLQDENIKLSRLVGETDALHRTLDAIEREIEQLEAETREAAFRPHPSTLKLED